MANHSNGNDWTWVTHFLAVFFAVVCMGLVIYSVVRIDNIDVARATMGFSSAILGVILGFYFNRERLVKESRQKDYFSRQASELESAYGRLSAALSELRDAVEEEPEEE